MSDLSESNLVPPPSTIPSSGTVPLLTRPNVLLGIVLSLVAIAVGVQAFMFAMAPQPVTDEELREIVKQRVQIALPVLAAKFDLSQLTIPLDQLRSGGVGKDQIRALVDPVMLVPDEDTFKQEPVASWTTADYLAYLRPEHEVVGIVIGGQARAYPLRILTWHEVINDNVAGVPIAVTYCPLCDSAVVFDRRVGGKVVEFGVSGRLYNSNVVMYNRVPGAPESESLWSQIMARAISGPEAHNGLKTLPVEVTTWELWWRRHPESSVMTDRIPESPNYAVNPYRKYLESPRLMFPVEREDDRLPRKQRVLGVWTTSAARAYPLSAFGDEAMVFDDDLGGHKLTLHYDPEARSLRIEQAGGGVQWMYAFWFAWYAFHPETDVYGQAGEDGDAPSKVGGSDLAIPPD